MRDVPFDPRLGHHWPKQKSIVKACSGKDGNAQLPLRHANASRQPRAASVADLSQGFRNQTQLPQNRDRSGQDFLGAGRTLRRNSFGLAGGLDLEIVEAVLRDAGAPNRTVLVGHDPDFSDLANELTGGDVSMKKGALVRIDYEGDLGAGSVDLRWLLPPDALGS